MNGGAPSEWLRPRRWLTALVLVGAALAMVWPTLKFPDRWGDPYDWRYFETMEEVSRVSVVEHHQVPLWDPWVCGGEVGLANPQSTVASPTFLLTLLFGTPLGLKLALLVYLLCALHGAYVLARRLGVSYGGALASGLAFGTSGWFAMHLSSGHINFAGAALFPYLVYCYLRASQSSAPSDGEWAWAIPGGAVLAWMAGYGGTYTAPMGAVLLGVWGATDAVERLRETGRAEAARPILVCGAIGLGALAVGAVRFLPVLEFALHHPRHVAERDGLTAWDLGRALFSWRQQLAPVEGHVYWWHEYCCHLGYVVAALVIVAVVASRLRAAPRRFPSLRRLELVPLAAFVAWTILRLTLVPLDARLARYYGYADGYHLLGAASIWLATRDLRPRATAWVLLVALGITVGRAWPFGPWWLLRKLPLYGDLRVPSRYLVVAAVPLALWAGQGVDALAALAQRRGGRPILAALALVLVGIEGLAFAAPCYVNTFTVLQEPPAKKPPFRQESGDKRWMFSGVLEGRGTLDCDEEAPLERADALDVGAVDQVRLVEPDAGRATLARFSPNVLIVDVELARPTTLLVNENWNEHWRADGGELTSAAGRLAARVAAGRHTVTFTYRPTSYRVGLAVSLLATPLALALFLFGALRRRTP